MRTGKSSEEKWIKPGKLDVGRVNGSRNVGDVIFNGKWSRQSALGEVAEVEAGVDGKDLGGERFEVLQMTNYKLQITRCLQTWVGRRLS